MVKWPHSIAVVTGLLASIASLPAGAQDQAVGSIVGYSDWGGIVRGSSLTNGQLGLPVSMGDLLRTAGRKGKIELQFIDETKFVVGRDSEVVIDKFVFSGQRTVSSLVLQAAKGSFRFVSGNSPSSAYQVQTRSATLGFRGTAVDFSVMGDGSTAVAVYEGMADLCDRRGRCVQLREPCGIGIADPFRGVREVVDAEERADLVRDGLPYATPEQNRLRRDFRLGTDDCLVASLPVDPTTTQGIPPAASPFNNQPGANLPPGQNPPPQGNPPPEDPVDEPAANFGNPGTGGNQGNANPSAGGGSFGDPGSGRGRSDSDDRGNSSSNSSSSSGGGGNGGGNGNSGGGNNGNGQGNS